MSEWRVTGIHSIQLNDAVDDYEGSLQLSVSNGERVRDLRCPFRRRSEGGIERYDEGQEGRVIWRWENPPELDGITLAESIGWELSDETSGWDVHGYVRGGEWESA